MSGPRKGVVMIGQAEGVIKMLGHLGYQMSEICLSCKTFNPGAIDYRLCRTGGCIAVAHKGDLERVQGLVYGGSGWIAIWDVEEILSPEEQFETEEYQEELKV